LWILSKLILTLAFSYLSPWGGTCSFLNKDGPRGTGFFNVSTEDDLSTLTKWLPLATNWEVGIVLKSALLLAMNWGFSFAYGPPLGSPPFFPHWQHDLFSSASLKNGNGWETLGAPRAQGQHSTLGTQLGFSQTNSHLGLGHAGLWHFQSHLGSSQTGSHSGLGA